MDKQITQHQAVIQTIEQLGGIATLGQLYREVLKITACRWITKTPFATIRRIVQTRPEIYKIKPGLYGLVSFRAQNEASGYFPITKSGQPPPEAAASDHTYYQGLLLSLGQIRAFDTYAPDQDRNRRYLNTTIGGLRTLQQIPPYTYPELVRRSATIDVIWFGKARRMPVSFQEVEATTDFKNSLLKFMDLQDFCSRMLIVAPRARKGEFTTKLGYTAFGSIASRVEFLDFESLVKQYESAIVAQQAAVLV